MSVQFVVDNRQFPCQDFRTEASLGSYHRNVVVLIGKYCVLCGVYSWLKSPYSIAFALSPDKIRIAQNSNWNVSQICNLLEPRYSCMGSYLIPKTTWSVYLVDALRKLLDSHLNFFKTAQTPKGEPIWFLFSTDLGLLGDERSTCVEEGLEIFCTVCDATLKQVTGLKIRIVCTAIDTSHRVNPTMVKVLSKLSVFGASVTFTSVVNTALNFDEELRCMVSLSMPRICTKIEFPFLGGSNCSLVLHLCPTTGTAGNAMHLGLKQPEVCGLVRRTQVAPSYIDGKALRTTYPSLDDAAEYLISERRCPS